MPIKKRKISELPEAGSLVGLYTIGVDNENKSVKASLEFVKTAADNANEATEKANTATEAANVATSNANASAGNADRATEAANQATKDATDAAKNANDATAAANEATQKTLEATTAANEATTKATIAADSADRATEAANNATTAANQATTKATTAADNADRATEAADTATEQANQATTAANTAASNANIAADSANEAAENANSLKNYVDETFSTKEETRESLAEKIDKAVIPTIVSEVSLEADESSVKLSITNKKTDNGSETLEEIFLPVASEDQHGIMPSESFKQIATNTADIELLKGVGRVSVHLGEEPTQEQLSFAWTAVKGSPIPTGATVVNFDQSAPAGHAWTYFEISTDIYEWQDRGTDTVNQATNEVLGIVKGVVTGKGKVFVENDGTMSVIGWDELEAGSAKNMVTLDTPQEIMGTKTFTSRLYIDTATNPGVDIKVGGVSKGLIYYENSTGQVRMLNRTSECALGISDTGAPLYYNGTNYTIWHSGNSNLSTVDWNAKNAYVSGRVYSYNKQAIGSDTTADTWLRLNGNGDFTSGIYLVGTTQASGNINFKGKDLSSTSNLRSAVWGDTTNRYSLQPTRWSATVAGGGAIYSPSIFVSANDTHGYISLPYDGTMDYLCVGGGSADVTRWTAKLFCDKNHVSPSTGATYDLGNSLAYWRNLYVNTITSSPGNTYGLLINPLSYQWSYIRFAHASAIKWDVGVNNVAEGSAVANSFQIRALGTATSRAWLTPTGDWYTTGAMLASNYIYTPNRLCIGTNLTQSNANRAEMHIVSSTDVPCDIWMGSGGGRNWSITARATGDNLSFGVFNAYRGDYGLIITRVENNFGIGYAPNTTLSYKLQVNGNAYIATGINSPGANYFGNNRSVIDTSGRFSPYSTSTRATGVYGVYDSTRIGHVWSMGTSYTIPDSGNDFGNLYGMAYKHTNNTTGGSMAGGHQIVFCNAGTPGVAIGMIGNIWNNGTLYNVGYGTFLAGSGTGSDMRFKKNFFKIPSILNDIQKVEIFGYDWERQGDESYTTIGLNGNELEKHEIFKYFTRRENEGDRLLTVDYGKLAVTVAVMGIQALYEENTKLKKALGVVCDKLNLNMEDLL